MIKSSLLSFIYRQGVKNTHTPNPQPPTPQKKTQQHKDNHDATNDKKTKIEPNSCSF